MNEFRVSPEAQAQLDAIWLHIARQSCSIDTANRIIDNITDRFWLLARHPYTGRQREDLGSGVRSFPTATTSSFIGMTARTVRC
jgi:plasmid stabilization system protein ParE